MGDPTGLAPVVKEVEWGTPPPLNVCPHRDKPGGRGSYRLADSILKTKITKFQFPRISM